MIKIEKIVTSVTEYLVDSKSYIDVVKNVVNIPKRFNNIREDIKWKVSLHCDICNRKVEDIITHGIRRANDEYCDWDDTLVVPGSTSKVYLYYDWDDDDQIICEKCIYEDVDD